jgi:Uma2 family endonuclease
MAAQTEAGRLEEELYEEIDGQRIEMPLVSYYAGITASDLGGRLMLHVHQQVPPLGKVVLEVLFRLPLANGASRNRRADIAFVSFERWPMDRPKSSRDNAWDVVPDLAVEVISPGDLALSQFEKVLEYFEAGVRLVWEVYPEQRHVRVSESSTQVRMIPPDGTLDGGVVLPDFRLPLAELFDPITPTGADT